MRPPLLAEFATEAELLRAARRLREAGYRQLEVYSPYPIEEVEEIIGLRRSTLPWAVGIAALLGGIFGVLIQWFTNAWNYPINVGGRPLLSWPAWVPITFEMAILAAASGAFLALLASSHLPRLWVPVLEIPGFERASTDRFWIALEALRPGEDREEAARELEALEPLRIAILDEEEA